VPDVARDVHEVVPIDHLQPPSRREGSGVVYMRDAV
jgi:hypothetical protein